MFLSQLFVNTGRGADHPGSQWIRNVYRVHQRLWMAFPDSKARADDPFFLGPWSIPESQGAKPTRDRAGFLFRIESDGAPRILVQSVQRPDWDYAFQNAPYLLSGPPNLREFNPTPKSGQAYRFRLLANVIRSKSVAQAGGTMRKARPIPRRKRTEELIAPVTLPAAMPTEPAERERLLRERWDPWRRWLQRMGEGRGFRVLDEGPSPLLMQAVHCVVQNPRRGDGNNGHGAREKRYNAGLFNGTLICTSPGELRSAIVNGVGHAKAFGFGLLSVAPVGDDN